MSLTLLYRGKNVRFTMRLKKAHWVSALIVFALMSGFIIHLFISNDATPMAMSSDSFFTNNTQLDYPKDLNNKAVDSQQKTLTLSLKLAELQSQVLRLNALGDRLASDAKIPMKEFDFNVLPPSGGPIENIAAVNIKSFTELLSEVLILEKQLPQEENKLRLLESLALGHHIQDSSYLSGRPIKRGWLSSYYGIRKDPFHGKPAMHKGVDFAGKEDSAIIATASGVVSWASDRFGYGNLIEINHGNGLKTRYGHNKEILVNVGDVVEKGQIIAHMGSTGRSTGPHVHYEILRKNRQINPLKFVYRKAKK